MIWKFFNIIKRQFPRPHLAKASARFFGKVPAACHDPAMEFYDIKKFSYHLFRRPNHIRFCQLTRPHGRHKILPTNTSPWQKQKPAHKMNWPIQNLFSFIFFHRCYFCNFLNNFFLNSIHCLNSLCNRCIF